LSEVVEVAAASAASAVLPATTTKTTATTNNGENYNNIHLTSLMVHVQIKKTQIKGYLSIRQFNLFKLCPFCP